MLEDVKLQALGGLSCGLQLFNLAVIPMLLNNAGTWTEMDEKTLKELDKLQVLFLSVLLAVPIKGIPRAAIFWDTGTIKLELEIVKRKLNLIQHIKSLDQSCLAKEVYDEQLRNNWPGLTQECIELCETLNIPNITTTEFTKGSWKNRVNQAIKSRNTDILKKNMEQYSKLEEMKNEEKCEIKDYFKNMTMQWRKLVHNSR